MLKRILVLACFIAFVSSPLMAQRYVDENSSFSERLYFGGGLGFTSSSYATVLNLSPSIGYMFTPKFSSGVGVIYQYVNYKSIDINTHNYGGRLFSRYNITPQFFAYGEYELLNYEFPTANGSEYGTVRELSPSLFVGAGYFQPFGRRGGISFMFLYNLIYDEDNSSYPRPYVVRVGISL